MNRPRLRTATLCLPAALLLSAACNSAGAFVGKWVGEFEVTDAAIAKIARGASEQERARQRHGFDTQTVSLEFRKDGTFFMIIFDMPMEGEWHMESGEIVARPSRVRGAPQVQGENALGDYYYKVRRYSPDSTKKKLVWRDTETNGYEIHFAKQS